MHEQDFKNIRDGFINTPAQCSVIIQVLRITRKLMEGGDTTQTLWSSMMYLCTEFSVFPTLKRHWKTEQYADRHLQ